MRLNAIVIIADFIVVLLTSPLDLEYLGTFPIVFWRGRSYLPIMCVVHKLIPRTSSVTVSSGIFCYSKCTLNQSINLSSSNISHCHSDPDSTFSSELSGLVYSTDVYAICYSLAVTCCLYDINIHLLSRLCAGVQLNRYSSPFSRPIQANSTSVRISDLTIAHNCSPRRTVHRILCSVMKVTWFLNQMEDLKRLCLLFFCVMY